MGLDDIQAGARTYVSGEYVETGTYHLAKWATGSEAAARAIDIGTGIVSPGVGAAALVKGSRLAGLTRIASVAKSVDKLDDAFRVTRAAQNAAKATKTAAQSGQISSQGAGLNANLRVLIAPDELSSITKQRVIEGLVGTRKAREIAAALRDGKIGLSILGDELFDRRIGSGLAKQIGNQIYIRRSLEEAIIGSVVHEGTHALDELSGFGRIVFRDARCLGGASYSGRD